MKTNKAIKMKRIIKAPKHNEGTALERKQQYTRYKLEKEYNIKAAKLQHQHSVIELNLLQNEEEYQMKAKHLKQLQELQITIENELTLKY